VKLFYKQN